MYNNFSLESNVVFDIFVKIYKHSYWAHGPLLHSILFYLLYTSHEKIESVFMRSIFRMGTHDLQKQFILHFLTTDTSKNTYIVLLGYGPPLSSLTQ